ncbi:hypothetical protein WDU94_007455 [Cyamophila willieti]
MPTYLVGFSVFEFDKLSTKDETFRVWGREDVIQKQGKYIFEKGPLILNKLSEYMGIDYYTIMPKMDLVAVPDFDAGAMENWGMTTYRENYIFFDKDQCSAPVYISGLSLVSHVFSHHWFGSIVTAMKWDYAWLNEAFGRYYEFFGLDLVNRTTFCR